MSKDRKEYKREYYHLTNHFLYIKNRLYILAEEMGLEPTHQVTPMTDFPGRTDTNFG